jgi:predicted MFS family arabinose efflux permease
MSSTTVPVTPSTAGAPAVTSDGAAAAGAAVAPGAAAKPPVMPFTPYQKIVVAILTFLQFTIVLDFMMLAPLGARLMAEMHIPPGRFGLVVSAYAFSAGISGFLAAGFADRFDRKRLLLFFYTGFLIGTLLCGIAPTYHFLLIARIVTGVFGGVIGSISFAIIADLFPFQQRGRVMGFVQTAFAASQVMGIPVALILSDKWGWHAPFLMLVALVAVAGVFIAVALKPIDAHLKLQRDGSALGHLVKTVSRPRYLQGFGTMALLVTGGFMLMPFSSAFSVHNLGISMDRLKEIYFVTGLFSIIAGPLLGRFGDSVGKYPLFCIGSAVSAVMILIYTHLGVTPIWQVILINVLLFVGITSRIISSSALVSAVPDPAHRGSFMAVNSSIQQVSGGIAAAVGGLIVVEGADGSLGRYDVLGYVVTASMVVTVVLMYFINRMVSSSTGGAPAAGGAPAK